MIRLYSKKFIYFSRRILLSGIILLGVLYAVARLILPTITDYREEIELLVADIVGAPVTIKRIESGWSGLRPVVSLHDVNLKRADGRDGLTLDSLDVVLGVLPSLLTGEFTPKAVLLHMRQLELYRSIDGSVSLNLGEFSATGDTDIDYGDVGWILEQPDLQVDIDHFVLNDAGGKMPDIRLHDVSIDFIKTDDDLYARVSTGDSEVAKETNLTVRLDAAQLEQGYHEGEVFMHLKSASLAFWKKTFEKTFVLPETGMADLTLWVEVDDGDISQLSGELQVKDLLYPETADSKSFRLQSLSGNYRWQSTEKGWLLEVGQLQLQRQDDQWPESALSVEYRRGNVNRFLVNADHLRVQDFLPLVDRQPLVHSLIGEKLQRVSPAGQVDGLRLQFSTSLEDEELSDYALQASITGFSLDAHGQWPGVKGVDGYVAATSQAGLLQLSTSNALLDLKTVFRDPLRIKSLQGDINWTWLDSGLLIESSQLDANNSHITTQSRLSIHLPHEGSVFLDLQTNFKDGDGAYTSFYLPANTMDEEALEWLDKSIVAGQVEYGSFIFHGVVDDFPFDNNNGRFEVSFKMRDGVLDYYEDWPLIDEIEAEVAFIGRAMRINASSGKIFGADIRDTVVSIADLDHDNPLLVIDGSAETPSADLFRYLEETELTGDFEQALSELDLRGKNDLDLTIKVPLSVGDASVKGRVAFLDNQLNIESWGLQVDHITGLLDFTDQSFKAENIRASFDDRNVKIDVDTVFPDDGESRTRVRAQGSADLVSLIKPKSEGIAAQFSGETPFEVLIDIPDQSASSLTITSSLVGTELKFPHPLDKQLEDRLDFRLHTGFSGEAAEHIEMMLGDRLSAFIVVDPKTHLLTSTYAQFGSGEVVKDLRPGELVVGGQLDFLDIDAWKRWYRRNQQAFSRQDDNTTFTGFAADVQIDRLRYSRWQLQDFHVKAASQERFWSAELDGSGVKGRAGLRAGEAGAVLDIELQHLALHKADEVPSDESEEIHEASRLTPSDLPAANIKIDRIAYDGRELGELVISTDAAKSRYKIKEMLLTTEESSMSIKGDWKYVVGEAGNKHLTQMLIDIDSKDFGRMMERLGYDDTVKGGEGALEVNLLTEVSPMDMDVSNISGDVELTIHKGEVIEVKPGGTGRIFGLLSLQTLPRRLSLDFTDIFSTGMSFDEITGTFSVSDGQAYTNNLTMDAPSSQVEISGRIGLADEDYDQHVRVIPNFSSTLPVAGALAGGPGLAVVMLITHQLLQDPIDKLTEFEYQVTGPWKSPVITKITSDEGQLTQQNDEPEDSTVTDDTL